MRVWKRALLSMKEKKGKTLMQLLIFTVICVLILSGLSVKTAANASADLAKESLGGEVTLAVDREAAMEEGGGNGPPEIASSPVAVEEAETIAELEQVRGYNYLTSTLAEAADFDAVEESSDTSESAEEGAGFGGGGMMQGDVSLQGVLYSDAVDDFMNGDASLVEGRHITKEDQGSQVAMIEETLAEANDLETGDTISLESTEEDASTEVEIIGVYESGSTTSSSNPGMNIAAQDPSNTIYLPYTEVNTLTGEEATVDSAVYYLNDAEEAEAFTADAEEASDLDFDTYALTSNISLYEQMIGPIENVASFSTNIVYIVTAAGASILGLIVMLSIRERKYEMGVLMAIGEKKSRLAGQFLAEILIVAAVAVGLSVLIGNVVADQLGTQLLEQQVSATENTETSPESFGPPGGMGEGNAGMGGEQAEVVDSLDVSVTWSDIGVLAGLGGLIAVVAALLPSVSILRMQPKQILTKQE
ncbi:ABC transporter permease [uncultured Marinococcus sp.]|uniref:ABC transporter permease n=1 Tax=uncultured Marinococcus sp. TaxID=487012 RepID=UPI0026061870|nr:ABC transporter permease [uncultured Marinococcus sp.]